MLDDLSERLLIRELIERYTDALNVRDFDTLGRTFLPNGEWCAGAPYNINLRGAEIVRSISGMLDAFSLLFQMTHGISIELAGDKAKARTTVVEVGQAKDGNSGLKGHGLYYDDLVRTEEGWRFARRYFEVKLLDTSPLPGTVIAN